MPLVVAQGPPRPHLRQHLSNLERRLTRAAYGQWNKAQLRTPWGSRNLQRFALLADDGSLLASAKRYRIDVSLDGRDGWMAGIGAVFTPESRRGQGHASRLIEMLVERERAAGALLSGLFSEIGAAFYERLGFRPVPLDEVTVTVKRQGGAPAMLVRGGDERDLPNIAALHAIRAAGARFAVRRDPSLLGYALSKKRLLAGLGPPGPPSGGVLRCRGRRDGCVVRGPFRECERLDAGGSRRSDPAGARLGAMLQVLLAREPSHRTPLIRAWWPRSMPVPPQIELTDRIDARDVFMVRPLADVAMPATADDVFYWRSDYF
jgi:GNAT superfamily N-acetyltransferase